MKLIVGLGNPGPKFKNSRHNFGYLVLDSYARNLGLSWRYSPDFIGYFIKSTDFILLKPSTFMNKSGESVRPLAAFYKIKSWDILVIHDDLDLDFGKIRLSFDSTSAGHKGIDSIIESISTMEFARLRLGIGKPKRIDSEKYVLEEFEEDQQETLKKVIKKANEAASTYLISGLEATMNLFN